MFDFLPFPNITAKEPDEKISQIVDYLLQFKEDLEFILTNLSTENLSPELQSRIASLKASTDVFTNEQTEQIKQMNISVSDVMNSPAFIAYAEGAQEYTDQKMESLTFSVDYETGYLNFEFK